MPKGFFNWFNSLPSLFGDIGRIDGQCIQLGGKWCANWHHLEDWITQMLKCGGPCKVAGITFNKKQGSGQGAPAMFRERNFELG